MRFLERVAGRPELVRRFVSIKGSALGYQFGRRIVSLWLPLKEKRRRKELEETFHTIKKRAIEFEHTPYFAARSVCNFALWLLLTERDISVSKVPALTSKNEWERKLHLRVILLTIHEWDIDAVAGREFLNHLDLAGISDETRQSTIHAIRKLRKSQKSVKKEFKEYRNNTIAHRNSNALLQYRKIRNLEESYVFQMAAEFYEAADEFIALVPTLMIEMSKPDAFLKQMTFSKDQKTSP